MSPSPFPTLWSQPDPERVARWSVVLVAVIMTSYVGGLIVVAIWLFIGIALFLAHVMDTDLLPTSRPAPVLSRTPEEYIVEMYLADNSPEAHDRLERSLDRLYGLDREPAEPARKVEGDHPVIGAIRRDDGSWTEVRE